MSCSCSEMQLHLVGCDCPDSYPVARYLAQSTDDCLRSMFSDDFKGVYGMRPHMGQETRESIIAFYCVHYVMDTLDDGREVMTPTPALSAQWAAESADLDWLSAQMEESDAVESVLNDHCACEVVTTHGVSCCKHCGS